MSNKKKLPIHRTPEGVAIYPHVVKPDTKFVKTGEFHVKLALEGDDAESLAAQLDELAAAEVEIKKAAAVKAGKKAAANKIVAHCNYSPEEDDDGNETGRTVFGPFKLKQQVIDSDGNLLFSQRPDIFMPGQRKPLSGAELAEARVWGGTILRIAFQAVPFFSSNDKKAGVSLRMKAIQIIDLVGAGERDASGYGFDVDEDEAPFAAEAETGGDFSEADEF